MFVRALVRVYILYMRILYVYKTHVVCVTAWFLCVDTYIYIYMCIYTFVYMSMFICVSCMYVYIYTHIDVRVCISIHICMNALCRVPAKSPPSLRPERPGLVAKDKEAFTRGLIGFR